MKMRKISFLDYSHKIGLNERTMRKYLQNPAKHFTIEMCEKSDEILNVPKGTSAKITKNEVELEDVYEYIHSKQ